MRVQDPPLAGGRIGGPGRARTGDGFLFVSATGRWSARRSRPEEATVDPKVRATRRPTNAATGIRTKMRVRVNPVGLVVGAQARSLTWLRFVTEGLSVRRRRGNARSHACTGRQTRF